MTNAEVELEILERKEKQNRLTVADAERLHELRLLNGDDAAQKMLARPSENKARFRGFIPKGLVG